MKLFVAIVSVFLVGLVAADAEDENACFDAIYGACKPNSNGLTSKKCDSKYGGFDYIEEDLQAYANQQLIASYDYLMLSTVYNSYQKDRPGFSKLFRSLSDKAFENSIKIIKQITRRGGAADFGLHQRLKTIPLTAETFDLDELHAVAKALDMEKNLAKKAIDIHSAASKITHSKILKPIHDPEITQFLEEDFLQTQAADIRKLSGFSNDLWKMMSDKTANTPLSVYLFDEYLQKL